MPDIDTIVHSFDYFATKYDHWHIIINQQSQDNIHHRSKIVNLHASTYSKKPRCQQDFHLSMVLGTFDMHSTATTDAQQHAFYSNISGLQLCVPLNMTLCNNLPGSPPYQNIDFLLIRIGIYQTDDKNEQSERVDKISRLMDLNHVTRLEFDRRNDLSQLYFIEQVLLTTPKVVQLTIPISLFLSPVIFDNPSLILPFSRLQSFAISTKHVYFPMKNAFKFVQQFPSLVHIRMRVFLLDTCVPIIDILLVNDPCSINYVVEKRRQTCPLDICKKDEISVKVDTQFLEIYLSGCSICAKKKYYI
ncbi:unnamed protein product [Rotaria sp. Silwood2]|nr:unnamed protein product [Rotaria sp. Silwood2]